MITKPLLEKILKGILHTEDENKHSSERIGIANPHNNRQAQNLLHTHKNLHNKSN
jgi:hypothetical protein